MPSKAVINGVVGNDNLARRAKWEAYAVAPCSLHITGPRYESLRLLYRFAVPEYSPSQWNFTREQFEKEIAGKLGIATVDHG